uniref:Putative cytochrome n=1 Tax=Ixodes scapularis TaxID=6945 RepID=A0A4D5RSH0_IXOSC
MWLLLVAASGVVLLVCRWLLDRSEQPRTNEADFAPGPQGLPLVGYSLGAQPLEKLNILAEQYGPVFAFRFLGRDYVHLGTYSSIREAYIKLGDCFVGRPRIPSAMAYLLDCQGISECEGQHWTEHRRFVLHTLRDFCFGKLSVEDRVHEAADRLVARLEGAAGRALDPEPVLNEAVVSVLASLLFDVPSSDDQGDLARLIRLVNGATPFLHATLPNLWTCATPIELSAGFSELQRLKRDFHALLDKLVAEHERSLDESRLRDYMDVYLDERRRAMEEGSLDGSTFTIHRLKTICLDLLLSGTAPTTALLCWALKLVARHPEAQVRAQGEMDAVLASPDQLGSLFSRDNLPFTEAMVLEVHRLASVCMLAPLRTNSEETTVGGFRIRAGSRVLANLWRAHRDPDFWSEPERFDPKRFLGEDGRPDKKDAFMPFSLGKRGCLGESLARTEAFVFLTELLKKFSLAVTEPFQDQELGWRPPQGTLRFAEPFELIATPRTPSTAL